MARATNDRIDDLAGVVSKLIDMFKTLLSTIDGIPPSVFTELDTMDAITFNCVSAKTAAAIAKALQPPSETENEECHSHQSKSPQNGPETSEIPDNPMSREFRL